MPVQLQQCVAPYLAGGRCNGAVAAAAARPGDRQQEKKLPHRTSRGPRPRWNGNTDCFQSLQVTRNHGDCRPSAANLHRVHRKGAATTVTDADRTKPRMLADIWTEPGAFSTKVLTPAPPPFQSFPYRRPRCCYLSCQRLSRQKCRTDRSSSSNRLSSPWNLRRPGLSNGEQVGNLS